MRKGILLIMLALLSVVVVACDEIGRYSVSPFDSATNTFDLLFDEIGQTLLIKKKISIDISDDSDYTGNFVGPASIVILEYTLSNMGSEDRNFNALLVYPKYESREFNQLIESISFSINNEELIKTYYTFNYFENVQRDKYENGAIDEIIEYSDFNYDNVITFAGDEIVDELYSTNDINNFCSKFSINITVNSEIKIKIVLPTWPMGERSNPARNIEYLLTLDNLHFDDVQTVITVSGNRVFDSTNHIKDDNHILIDKESGNTIYVRTIFKSLHYSSWTPYCSYKG